MDKVVVISGASDSHIPFVRSYISSQFIIVDPYAIINNEELSYTFDGLKCLVTYKGVALKNVKSVWYRNPLTRLPIALPVTEEYRQYTENAINGHSYMLCAQFADAHWVSSFYATNRARNKASQLEIAARLGFAVPETLMTSDQARARDFLRKHTPAIVKPQKSNILTPDKAYCFFTTRIASPDTFDLTNLHLAPAIFQKAIDALADIRVTVVGSTVFASIIKDTTKSEQYDIRDWRLLHEGKTHFENYDKEFPAVIRQQCRELVRAMGLEYGAIDLVLDKQGVYWFLEINPNGQWAFIEEDTRQPIGRAMAKLLEQE